MLRHMAGLVTDDPARELQKAAIGRELCDMQMVLDRHFAELPVVEHTVELGRIEVSLPTFNLLKRLYRYLYPDPAVPNH